MKKLFAIITTAALIGQAAFAQGYDYDRDNDSAGNGGGISFSVGAGIIGVAETSVTTYTAKNSGGKTSDSLADKTDVSADKMVNNSSSGDFGGYLFFDATYVEADLDIVGTSFTLGGATGTQLTGVKLGITALGKYPIKIGTSGLTIAPLLGISYDILLGATTQYGNAVAKTSDTGGLPKYPNKADASSTDDYKNASTLDLSTLSLKLGAGAEFPISEKIYLSAQYLWGIVFNSTYNQKWLDYNNKLIESVGKSDLFTSSSTFKFAVGYRL